MSLTFDLTITGTLTAAPSGEISGATSRVQTGSNGFDAISETYTFGTGDNNAKEWYSGERTLSATTGESLDLAGGLTSPLGATITFTKIKELYIEIDAPDGTKSLRVGPQAVSNALVLPFADASDYLTIYDKIWISNPYGYAVTASTADLLRIYNPGASSITYRLFVVGTV